MIDNTKMPLSPIRIIDSTLRDGEQAPGIVFSGRDKLEIAAMLQDAGVDEIEAGIPAMGKDECETITAIRREVSSVDVISWCRAVLDDLYLAAACDTGRVHISFPVSSILLRAFDKNEAWVLKQMETLIPLAREMFDFVSVGAQDAARCNVGILKKLVRHAGALGAERFRIADTVGISSPLNIHSLFQELRDDALDMVLEFHGHNDLGMATANTVSAVSGGAGAVSVTVGGIGERAGNAPFEEVAVALEKTGTGTTNVRFEKLNELCHHVAAVINRPIAPDKPVTGSDIFTHESGIHCNALLKDELSYQSILPSELGLKTETFQVGKFSGTSSVKHVLKEAGVTIDDRTANNILPLIRKSALEKKRALTVAEVLAMVS